MIEQTGTHRRIVFGEVFTPAPGAGRPSDVVRAADAFTSADIQAEPVADARVPLWEKFIYLAAYAAFSGSARKPAGAIWGDAFVRERFLSAVDEVYAVAQAEGVPVPPGQRERVTAYMNTVPATMRASLLIDLQQGKRIEVEALQGSVVRRGAARGVPTPIMSTLYAVLRAASAQATPPPSSGRGFLMRLTRTFLCAVLPMAVAFGAINARSAGAAARSQRHLAPITQPAPAKTAGFDAAAIDRGADACTDFYQFACGAWMKNNPIPEDQASWGRFNELVERNRETLRGLLVKLSEAKAERTAPQQKLGDYYATCTDESSVEALGAKPLADDLARIAAVADKNALPAEIGTLQRLGINVFFAFGPEQDFKESSSVIAIADQGGWASLIATTTSRPKRTSSSSASSTSNTSARCSCSPAIRRRRPPPTPRR